MFLIYCSVVLILGYAGNTRMNTFKLNIVLNRSFILLITIYM